MLVGLAQEIILIILYIASNSPPYEEHRENYVDDALSKPSCLVLLRVHDASRSIFPFASLHLNALFISLFTCDIKE